MYIFLAGLSALLYGISDFFGGFATRKSRVLSVLLLSQCIGITLTLLILTITSFKQPSIQDILFGLAAGITGTMGLLILYKGIANSIVAIVSPISAVIGAIVPVIFALINGEKPNIMVSIGSIICLPAIIMITHDSGLGTKEKSVIKRSILYGISAGIAFGIFFISLSCCNEEAGLWPLVAAKTASISIIVTSMVVLKQPFYIKSSGYIPGIIASVFDMGANILFMAATQLGMLSIAVIITSMFPAPTVVLARIFMHQKIPKVRLIGFILALVGIGLISAGRN